MEFKEFSEYTNPESENYDIKSSMWNNEEDPIEIPEDTIDYVNEDIDDAIDVPEEDYEEQNYMGRR